MPTVYINININTLFPIENLKDHLKEAIRMTKKNGYSVIVQNNQPAYAILKFPSPDNSTLLCDADDDCDANDADSGIQNNCASGSSDTSGQHFNTDKTHYEYIIDNDIRKPLFKYLEKLRKENPAGLRRKGNWWDADE